MSRRVVMVVFDGFQLIDLAGLADVFSSAAALGADPAYQVEIAAARAGLVRSSCGVEVTAPHALGALSGAIDTLLVTGGIDFCLLYAWICLADGYLGQREPVSWRRAVARAYELGEDEPEPVRHSKVCHDLDHDPDGAVDACKRALSVNPSAVTARTAFGELAWHHDDWEAAEEHLTAAAVLAPWNGTVVGVLNQFRAATGGDPLPSDDLEQQALETPYSGLAGHLGRIYCDVLDMNDQDRKDRAVRLLEAAAYADVENAEIHLYLAKAYYFSHRFADAAEEAERAVTLSSDYGDAWIWLGQSRVQLDEYPEAAEALERGLAQHPRDAQARHSYGIALDSMNERPQAVEQYLLALPYMHDDGGLLYNLANSHYEQGHFEQSRVHAERARKHRPPGDRLMSELLELLDIADQR